MALGEAKTFSFGEDLVFLDKSFEFVIKTPPAAVQLLEAAKVKKGSGEPNIKKVSKVTWDQVKTIAEDKMQDLNAFNVESAMKSCGAPPFVNTFIAPPFSALGSP